MYTHTHKYVRTKMYGCGSVCTYLCNYVCLHACMCMYGIICAVGRGMYGDCDCDDDEEEEGNVCMDPSESYIPAKLVDVGGQVITYVCLHACICVCVWYVWCVYAVCVWADGCVCMYMCMCMHVHGHVWCTYATCVCM